MTLRGATRRDPTLGFREEAAFLPSGADEIFGVTYLPESRPRAGIVLCCSLFAEHLKLYRTEVLAARAFAASGFAVIRFHYRGTGHSGGLTEGATARTMVDDAVWAADILLDRTGAGQVVFCGARWGGLVAGLAAHRRPGAPLALWEPVVDGETFLRAMLRARRMSALVRGEAAAAATSSAAEEFQANGVIDMMGYPIHLGLYDSWASSSLIEAAAGPARPVLLVQVSRAMELVPELARLAQAFAAGGSAVETERIERDETWSFVGGPLQSTDDLIAITTKWLTRTIPG